MEKKRSIIPGIVTMCNMVAGFFSILLSAQYDPQLNNVETLIMAGSLIFIAGFFDMFDGAIARALNVESELGMQLDSLADAVSYGIAPGVLAYQAYFYRLPLVFEVSTGALLAALFPICAIYRLARFNCEETGLGFKGLPSPPAGILIGMVPTLIISNNLIFGQVFFAMPLSWFIPLFIITALLMVSNFDYSKMFSVLWKKGITVRIITFIICITLLVIFKSWAIFTGAFLYMLWGIVMYLKKLVFKSE